MSEVEDSPQTTRDVWRLSKVQVVVLGLLAVGCGYFFYSWHRLTRPDLSIEALRAQSSALIEKAGGLEKIQKEAVLVFGKPVPENQDYLSKDELADFPALKSFDAVGLERVAGVARIEIRAGGHFDIYWIEIYSTNRPPEVRKGKTEIELVPDRIYVRR